MASKKPVTFSKIGVILASVGSSIGLGNIWRFPYEAGMNGGGAFLFIYILCVFLLGIPVMAGEFVMGRGSHHGPARCFSKLAPEAGYTHRLGYIFALVSLIIMGFYCVVSAWLMDYLFQAISGTLFSQGVDAESFSRSFTDMVSNPGRILAWTIIFLIFNYLVLVGGVKRGIENLSRVLMPIFAVIMVVFCVHSLRMPGAAEGLRFLFVPDFSALTPSVFVAALGQAFFSLSIGIGCLLVYSSYFSDETPLLRTGMTISILDTLVAVMAGVLIFPAVFTYGGEVAAGPKLVFEVLPAIFAQMPGGQIWAILFFMLIFFAAITSSISVGEVCVSFIMEHFRLRRWKSVTVAMSLILVLNVLCCLGFNVLSDWQIAGKGIFDCYDYITSCVLIPLAGLIDCIFVGWVLDKTQVEQQLLKGRHYPIWLIRTVHFLLRYVTPVLIAIIFLSGIL